MHETFAAGRWMSMSPFLSQLEETGPFMQCGDNIVLLRSEDMSSCPRDRPQQKVVQLAL